MHHFFLKFKLITMTTNSDNTIYDVSHLNDNILYPKINPID